ncbi:hypothetical protein ZWY2020_032189 [Hordeum vulgare]|nr:hypothetical protein ZWY2020_032189 [Hordeum vulgare]
MEAWPLWRWWALAAAGVLCLLLPPAAATLSPTGINYEVVALMAIKTDLQDHYNVLDNWDINSVDPCSWRMVTCSSDGYVSALGLPSQRLSGKLSPGIGNLTRLQSVLLQNNAISGTIPSTIGRLGMLQTLDMSDNHLTGSIPTSLGDLKNLNYLKLNNNSLSGVLPESLATINGLALVDLSFNNLSGPVPKISARTFSIAGNSMICGVKSGDNCSSVSLDPLSYPPDDLKIQPQQAMPRSHRIAIICGATVGSVAFVAIVVDVFGFGVLLVELITGQKALDFGRLANQKRVLDLVKKLHQEKQLNMMVDKDLGSNYDRVELEEMVQVALLCTQYYPSHRPRMSEVIRMLEGDGLAEKWEASQNVDTPKSVSSELLPLKFTDFAGADESSVGLEAMELSGPR